MDESFPMQNPETRGFQDKGKKKTSKKQGAMETPRALAMTFEENANPLAWDVIAVSWSENSKTLLKSLLENINDRGENDETRNFTLPFKNLRAKLRIRTKLTQLDPDVGIGDLNNKNAKKWWGLADAPENADIDALNKSLQEHIHDVLSTWCESSLASFAERQYIERFRELVQNREAIILAPPQKITIYPYKRPELSSPGLPGPFDITSGMLASHLAGKEIFPELGTVVHVVGGPDRNSAEIMTRPAIDPKFGTGDRFSLVCKISLETLPGSLQPLVTFKFSRRRWAKKLVDSYSTTPTIGGFVFPKERSFKAFRFDIHRKNRKWTTAHGGYQEYEHFFKLEQGYQDENIVHYPNDTDQTNVVVMVKHGVSEDGVKLKDGVPFVDQADAFNNLVREFQAFGLRPLRHDSDFKECKVRQPQGKEKNPGYLDDTARRKIYFLSENGEDGDIVKRIAAELFDNNIEVITGKLPANTHGPRDELPLADKSYTHRQKAREKIWEDWHEDNRISDRAMILIQAPEWFGPNSRKHDDEVNKPAARRALARKGCTVQYILPKETEEEDKRKKKGNDFEQRVKSALTDLVWGHGGWVGGLENACEVLGCKIPSMPRLICAITSIQKSGQSILVASKTECSSGKSWVKIADKTTRTNWVPFHDVFKRLSASDSFKLPDKDDAKSFFEDFYKNTMDEISEEDPNAVIFIDAVHSRRYAPWLTDSGMLGIDGDLAFPVSQKWQSLRLMRIREQAPVICHEKIHYEDGEPKPTATTWTAVRRLYQSTATPIPTFWSIDAYFTKSKRGDSCYRIMKLPDSNGRFSPYKKRSDEKHLNPQALEISILQKQPNDDAIKLAAFAHHLRKCSMATTNDQFVKTPAPLRIVDKLAEYMETSRPARRRWR